MYLQALTYEFGTTPVHRCDARVKLAVLLAFSVGVFIVRSWWGMAVLAAALAAVVMVARLSPSLLGWRLVPVFVLAAFSVLFNVLAAPGWEGLSTGLFLGARMVVLVGASFVVCLTSTSSQLLDAFSWFIAPLGRMGVPVDDIAFTLMLSLRFIPLLEGELATVRAAQKSRGAELTGSPLRKLRIWGAAFSAVFVGLFRHADAVATAMDARCYGAMSNRNPQA